MSARTVDRIRVTTVVNNYIDDLRKDDAIARRYSAFVTGKMPDLRAEHGLAHCGIGSESGWRLRVGGYVTGTAATREVPLAGGR